MFFQHGFQNKLYIEPASTAKFNFFGVITRDDNSYVKIFWVDLYKTTK